MQLITKLIKDKPILFGVRFDTEYRAVNKYKDFDSYFEKSFHAEIEIIAQEKLNLILICDNGERFEYIGLEFNPVRLRNFFTYVKPQSKFTFVHFYKHLDNELVAQDRFRKEKYIQVNGYTIKQQH